ncbi:hypothetical protein Lal_00030063 [Lupinus albus]|uniref:Non-specific lipid-transfer protein n=1 Tax=Lupinus albus TaxID=3870 RepID=A0A6A4QA50_LUPAL|nr:putative plant lipid transfer protein/Par allergen [Lupinus albus]KAF1876650.1 hypothetical protein Lal_00030063 [Lupinus albus]
MAGIKVACLVLMCMAVVAAPIAKADITCSQVENKIAYCIDYLKYGRDVSTVCCAGLRALISGTQSTSDKQALCNCLKSATLRYNPKNAVSLPGKCGVIIPYKISINTNCANIQFGSFDGMGKMQVPQNIFTAGINNI